MYADLYSNCVEQVSRAVFGVWVHVQALSSQRWL